ncbi:hypothetical protein ABPG75_005952 [Micractinium tetrahymenae]
MTKYAPSGRKQQGGGGSGRQDRAAAAAARAAAAAQKQAEKEARKRAQEFIKTVGTHLAHGLAAARHQHQLSATIDPAAFQYLFGDLAQEAEAGKGSKRRLRVKLGGNGAQAVFGKGRCVKKYRLGSVGSVTGMDISYDPALQKASLACTWSVDSALY